MARHVLEIHEKPCDPVCMDERPEQMVKEARLPPPQIRRVDYKRTDAAFMFCEALSSWRRATAGKRRTNGPKKSPACAGTARKSPAATPTPARRERSRDPCAVRNVWNTYSMHRIFFTPIRVRKTGNPPRRGRRFRRFHPKPAARMPSPNAGKKTGRRGSPWVVLPAAKPATL